MNTNLQRIKDIIYKSELSILEQEELIDLLSRAKNEDLEEAAELFTENPSLIKVLSDNYRAKQAVFATGSADQWKKILAKEEEMLENIG